MSRNWDDHDRVAEFIFSGASMFEHKHLVAGFEFSVEYFEERYEQFGGQWLDPMEPEYLDCIYPPAEKLYELFPPEPVITSIGSMTVVHNTEK